MPLDDETAALRDDLLARAEALRPRLQAGWTRPFFVEFTGTPKSGKSTTIASVAHFFHRLGYRVHFPTEGASKRTPPALKSDLAAFNTWSACYALMQVMEATHDPNHFDIVILDRGLFDGLVFFEMLAARGEVAAQDRDVIHRFLLLNKWREQIDLVCLFRADPETAMAHENKGKLTEKTGRLMNQESLAELNKAYVAVQEAHSEQFADFLLVDTGAGGKDEVGAALDVAETMVSLLEACTPG